MTSATLRNMVKKGLATGVGAVSPQARYERTVLVLSHMRAATTALSNVLCTHPDVSGYGETHVSHQTAQALGQIIVNQALRKAWTPSAPYLFDKVLHDRLDSAAPASFYAARAIFMVRAPAPAIRSIQALASKTGMKEGSSPEAAAHYYINRVETLCRHWDAFPATHRFGMTSESLLSDPDGHVARLGAWLPLSVPLENRYESHKATQVGGGGDPTQSGKFTQIQARPSPMDDSPVEGVPSALSEQCHQAFAQLVGRF